MSTNQTVTIEEERNLMWRVSKHIIRGMNGFAITYIHVLMNDDYRYYMNEEKLDEWIRNNPDAFKRGDIPADKMKYHSNILKEMLRLCALCQRNIDSKNRLFHGIQLKNDEKWSISSLLHNATSNLPTLGKNVFMAALPVLALINPQYIYFYGLFVGKEVVSKIPGLKGLYPMNWFKGWGGTQGETFIKEHHKTSHDPVNLQKVNDFLMGNYDSALWDENALKYKKVIHDPPQVLTYVEKSIMHRFAQDAKHIVPYTHNNIFRLLSMSSDAGGLDSCTKTYKLNNFPLPSGANHIMYLMKYNHPSHTLGAKPNYSMILVDWEKKSISIRYAKHDTERSVRDANKGKTIITIEVQQDFDHIHRFFPYYALRSICVIFSCRDTTLNQNMLSEWETNNGSTVSAKYVSFVKDVSRQLIEMCDKNQLYCKEMCQGAKLNMYNENTWSGQHYARQAQHIMGYMYDRNYYRYPVTQWSSVVSQNGTGIDLNSIRTPELFRYDYTCGTFYYQKIQHETISFQSQLWEGIKKTVLSVKYLMEKLAESLGYANPYLLVFQVILASGSIYVVGRLLYKFARAVFKSRRIKHASRAVRHKIQSAKQLMIQNPTPQNIKTFIQTVKHTPTFDFTIVLKAPTYLDRLDMYRAVEVIEQTFKILQVRETQTDAEKRKIKTLELDMNEVVVASDVELIQRKIKRLMVQNALMMPQQHINVHKTTHPHRVTFIVPIETRIIVDDEDIYE